MSTNSNNSEKEWLLELEESAQGTDLYEGPGGATQVESAREDAIDADVPQPEMTLVSRARAKRKSLGEAMRGLETSVSSAASSDGWAIGVLDSVENSAKHFTNTS